MKTYHYATWIKEAYLDSFGHVNNAAYLTLLEEARWDMVTQNNFGVAEIRKSGIGPVLLEIKLSFLKELHLRNEIIIETTLLDYKKKIGHIKQRILRGADVCCEADLVIGMFDLNARKLITPSDTWLNAIWYGVDGEKIN